MARREARARFRPKTSGSVLPHLLFDRALGYPGRIVDVSYRPWPMTGYIQSSATLTLGGCRIVEGPNIVGGCKIACCLAYNAGTAPCGFTSTDRANGN
jgi:hypothetical protein